MATRVSLAEALRGLRTKSQQIKAGRAAGFAVGEIAAHLGLSEGYVAKVAGVNAPGVGAPQPAMPKLPGMAPGAGPAGIGPGMADGPGEAASVAAGAAGEGWPGGVAGPVDPALLDALRQVSTATLSMQLLKRGIRRGTVQGVARLAGGVGRLVGPAVTLRFVPGREDLATPESYQAPFSLRSVIEAVPAGAVLVAATGGDATAGTIGDILAARLVRRGAAGFITDGAVRDLEGIAATGLAVFAAATTPPPSIGALALAGAGELVGLGGTAVAPGDVVVGDRDGVVVLPQALAAEMARDALEQERFERFVLAEVAAGRALPGLYPPDEATRARYAAWLKAGGG